MTTIPNKVGLVILAIFWSAMAGLTVHALRANETTRSPTSNQRSGGCSPPLTDPGVSREPEEPEEDVRSPLQTLFQIKERAEEWNAGRLSA